MFISIAVIWCVVLICILYANKKIYSLWNQVGVYTRKLPIFPIGSISELVMKKKTRLEFYHAEYVEMKSKNEKLSGLFYYFMPTIILSDLDLIKDIIIKDFDYFTDRHFHTDEENDPLTGHLVNLCGLKWKTLRAKLSPTFSSGKLKLMFHIFNETGEKLAKVLGQQNGHGQCKDIDIKSFLCRYTADIIGKCAYGVECNSLEKEENDCFVKAASLIFKHNFIDVIKILTSQACPSLFKQLKLKITKKTVEDFFMKTVKDVVDYRKANNVVRNDLMQLLIGLLEKGVLTFNEIAAQAFVYFGAGYDTSATTMAFALFELANNQDVQNKLRQEINETIEKHGEINYETILNMSYLDKVFLETLRKYPPFNTNRACTKEYTISGTKITIPKKTLVVVPIFEIHRDPEYYPNPERFNPERFSSEEKQKRHPCAFMPFGNGPRVCVGIRFAQLVVKVGLVQMLRNFRFFASKKTKLPLEFLEDMSLTAKGKIWLQFEKLQ